VPVSAYLKLLCFVLIGDFRGNFEGYVDSEEKREKD
jgi:hypothetical protein